MALLDHSRPPLRNRNRWPGFHSVWPTMLLVRLNRWLPEGYYAEPRAQLGTEYELDIGAFDTRPVASRQPTANGGAAAVLTAPTPTLSVATELGEPDEFGLRVFDTGGVLVAAVEFVSPANKDRPDTRRDFAENVGQLVRRGVSVSIVDVIGYSHFNLYADALGVIGHADPTLGDDLPPMYAVTCRTFGRKPNRRFASWYHPLAVGQPLPTLPLWLYDDQHIDLELELSYEDTRQALRLV